MAVLPFSDYASDIERERVASSATYLYCAHEGFKLVPIVDCFKATAADKEIEPGLPLRKSDAVRIGKALGADWVIYGEVKEADTRKKQGFFNATKRTKGSIRLSIADCAADKLIYWQSRTDVTVTNVGLSGRSTHNAVRVVLRDVTGHVVRPLCEAMPKHTAGKDVDTDELLNFVNNTWPAPKQ